ncbi:MAG TPA: radical SAM protein [Treponema sp.]|nr:radical SAM protein [Treponema sp.]
MHTIQAKSILSAQNGMNVYRGCTHGCIYCDARSTCYWRESSAHAFEDIEIKANAPELLEDALRRKRSRCMVGTGAMSDPYQQCEKDLRLTLRCIEIIDRYDCGLAVQTKSDMILRDVDVLERINRKAKCVVQMTLTTYDESLCRIVEPNVCTTMRRAEVLNVMRDKGIPTIVWFTPVLPFINDTEENVRGILDYCINAHVYGIIIFGIGLTLRDGDRQYFYKKLDEHFPGMKEKYMRTYGDAYELPVRENDRFVTLLQNECRKNNIVCDAAELFTYMRTLDTSKIPGQPELF